MYIGGILNDFTIVPKRDVPYFYIANTRSAMTGGMTTYEETVRSSGIMSVSSRVKVVAASGKLWSGAPQTIYLTAISVMRNGQGKMGYQ